MGKALINERYELRGQIGSGGMGHVYLAHDRVLDRNVALKMLKARYAENEEFVERFRREAKSAASLSHPNIVPVLDGGETGDGTYYIAMEYLPGGTLRDRIASGRTLPPRAVVEVALEIAGALQAAHTRGVIHRDIKPRNILITDSGHIKVTDFGIARAAEATTVSDFGDILGSAKYMSPEQAAGDQVGPASDLYSLGVVLYEILTGTVPYAVDTPWDVAVEHSDGPPPRPREVNPEVPEGLDTLVMRLLASDSEDRYASAIQLIKELRRVQDGLPPLRMRGEEATTVALSTPAAPGIPASATVGSGPARKKWFPIMAAFALLALLGAVGGPAGWNPLRESGAATIPEILSGTPGEPSKVAGKRPSGPEEVKVPGVEGSTGQEARERTVDAGFDTEVRPQTGPEENSGRVLEQSVPGSKEAEGGSKILPVDEGPEVAKVPDLVGLGYTEAENKLEEAGYLLGGVEEAPSETVPAGVIMKQDPQPETTLDPDSYVYLTTSVGPLDTARSGGGQGLGAAGSQHNPSGEASSEEAAAAIEGHYGAIGTGNFEGAYSYFGPTFRSQHDQASWIEGEQSYEIQSSTIHSLTVDEVLGTSATATVDISFVDNTGTPRFVIVWSLVQEGGRWKLDSQLSAQRVTEPQPDISSAPTVAPTALPSASPTPSGAGMPPVRTENEPPSQLAKGNQSGIYHGVDSRRYSAAARAVGLSRIR
jgi:eukaryotic-like serine/threonine-protein kinase